MAKEKYTLTPEHRDQLKPWADKWIANAMSTEAMDETDREAMRAAIAGLYAAANLVPPPPERIVFVPSPLVGNIAAGFAAAIWWLRNNAATDDATDAATINATDATANATDAATDVGWAIDIAKSFSPRHWHLPLSEAEVKELEQVLVASVLKTTTQAYDWDRQAIAAILSSDPIKRLREMAAEGEAGSVSTSPAAAASSADGLRAQEE